MNKSNTPMKKKIRQRKHKRHTASGICSCSADSGTNIVTINYIYE